MAKEYRVTLAGKTYELSYRLDDAEAIEGKAVAAGRTLRDMLGGPMIEKAAVVWGGLKAFDRKLTPAGVLRLFQDHVEGGGEWDRDVFVPCVRALIESRLLGAYNEREIDTIMKNLGEEQPGKAPAA